MFATATERHELVFSPASFNPRRVLIGGVGAGGSWLALAIAKLGVRNIAICDTQKVAIENVGPSLYGKKHVGMKKVDACAEIVYALSDDIEVQALDCRMEDVGDYGEAAFLCVDSMQARLDLLYDQCVPRAKSLRRVFEGRMSAFFVMGHSLDPGSELQVSEWRRYWLEDKDTLPALQGCGARPVSVGPTASVIANLMAHQFIQWWATVQGVRSKAPNQLRLDLDLWELESYCWE